MNKVEIQILEEKYSKLLGRKEIIGKINYELITPSNEDVKKSISDKLKSDLNLIRVLKIDNKVGYREATVTALIYDTVELLNSITKKGKKEIEKEKKSLEAKKKAEEKKAEDAKKAKEAAENKEESASSEEKGE